MDVLENMLAEAGSVEAGNKSDISTPCPSPEGGAGGTQDIPGVQTAGGSASATSGSAAATASSGVGVALPAPAASTATATSSTTITATTATTSSSASSVDQGN